MLQQIIQDVSADAIVRMTLTEQQANIGQIVQDIQRMNEEMAKIKLTLKQGFVLIDETCTKQAMAFSGLESFAGAQVGTNQKFQETMQQISGHPSVVQHRTRELQKDTSLDWRIQTLEDELASLQKASRPNEQQDVHSQTFTTSVREVRELQQTDTGDISPSIRTAPCQHMWRTLQAMNIPLLQSNRYANWVRCPVCRHTHAVATYSATCCLSCKETTNRLTWDHRLQRHIQRLSQPTQPP